MDSLLFRRGSSFLFYSGLQLIGQGPPMLGRTICFPQSTDLNSNLTKNTLTDTPRMLLDRMSECHLGPVRLTQELNHHSVHGCLRYTQWILMSEEGFMDEGRVRNVLADRGVLILLASRSPGLPGIWATVEPQAPPTSPGSPGGANSPRQVLGVGRALPSHPTPSRPGCAVLSTSPAPS